MTLYGKRLSYGAIVVLFVVITTFWVLALGSGLNFALLSVTHTCSEDRQIDCYPQLLQGANDTGLNITTSTPIQDCSFWKNKEIAGRVNFVCYQYILDIERFLSVIGGLLAVFIFAIKIAITLLRFLSVCCLSTHEAESNRFKKNRRCCLQVSRIMISVVASIVEIMLATFGYLLGVTGIIAHINEHTSDLTYFVAKHVTDFLLLFGLLSTLLWLPWEEYATDYQMKNQSVRTPDVESQTQFVGTGDQQETIALLRDGDKQESEAQLETATPLESGDRLETATLLETEA